MLHASRQMQKISLKVFHLVLGQDVVKRVVNYLVVKNNVSQLLEL